MKQRRYNSISHEPKRPSRRALYTFARGFTLVEVLISVLIIMVLVTGATAYQYYSTRDVKLAEVRSGAARLSMMLLETWKGSGGDETFDPVEAITELNITDADDGPPIPEVLSGDTLTLLGYYRVDIQKTTYYVTLSRRPASAQEPKVLSAITAWRSDHGPGELIGDEPHVRYATFCFE